MNPIIRATAMAVLASSAGICFAGTISFTGNLPDQDSVALYDFSVPGGASLVTLQSWSFGGGTNAALLAIPGGGFLLDISVFGGVGDQVLADTNFTYSCPPGNADPLEGCGDTTLILSLAPGAYKLSIVAAPNFPLGPALADGFNGAGSFIGSYGETRSSFYAVDVTVEQAIPEPATILLVALGALLCCLRKRRPGTRFPQPEPRTSGD